MRGQVINTFDIVIRSFYEKLQRLIKWTRQYFSASFTSLVAYNTMNDESTNIFTILIDQN